MDCFSWVAPAACVARRAWSDRLNSVRRGLLAPPRRTYWLDWSSRHVLVFEHQMFVRIGAVLSELDGRGKFFVHFGFNATHGGGVPLTESLHVRLQARQRAFL